MSELVFGQVVHPPYLDRPVLPDENYAWDDLGQRRAIGVVQHSMVGTLWGTDRWFRRGAASNGLTDYGIGGSADGPEWDGVIIRWNDPRGRKSGWANGGSDGLEGDGIAFVRKLGVNAINRDPVSIERSDGGDTSTPISPKQFESMCRLTATVFDQDDVPWDKFPLNPKYDLVTYLLHLEFATKACPFKPVVSQVDAIQDRVRAIMKDAQTFTEGDPIVPPPDPVQPPKPTWPNGWSTRGLASRWGTPVYRSLAGNERPFPFDPKGVLCNAWVARAVERGITEYKDIPKPASIVEAGQPDPGKMMTLAVFDGRGADNWACFRPATNIAWRWVTN